MRYPLFSNGIVDEAARTTGRTSNGVRDPHRPRKNNTSRSLLTWIFYLNMVFFCYNSECWESVHKRGVRASHRWEGFRAGSPACVACRRSPAERKCNVCNDLLCAPCYIERSEYTLVIAAWAACSA